LERTRIDDSTTGENRESALLQFDPEPVVAVAAANADRRMPPRSRSGPPPGPSGPASFFSETLEFVESEAPSSSPRGNHLQPDGRDGGELFGELLASSRSNWSRVTMSAAVVLVLVAIGVPASRWLLAPSVQAATTGILAIVTVPPGLTVIIDGTPSGTTPLNQQVFAGPHTVELRGAGPSRAMTIAVTAGGRAYQYVELAVPPGVGDMRSDAP
jgi:hypothetical protein